jgi:hypothetical protein
MRAGVRAAAALGALALLISGCESSQDLSARLAKEGRHALSSQRGLVIRATNRAVKVVHAGVVTDPNGTAAVVVLRNLRPMPLGSVPIAIDVRGPGDKSVFKNNAPQLESSLISISSLPPAGETTWVNDQVTPSGKALSVHAVIGAGGAGAPLALPRIDVGPPHVTNDPSSGLEASGMINNRSSVTQLKLVVYIVAWRGDKVASAGRGSIARLPPGAHTTYHVFLIGNPGGAPLTVTAPPTVLR